MDRLGVRVAARDARRRLVQYRAGLGALGAPQEAQIAGAGPRLADAAPGDELGREVVVVVRLVAVDREVAV